MQLIFTHLQRVRLPQSARVALRWATGEMPGQKLPQAGLNPRYETPAFRPV